MIEVIFSVPIEEEPVRGDSKLLALLRVKDKKRTLIKRSWVSSFDPTKRTVIFVEEVIHTGSDYVGVPSTSFFRRKDTGERLELSARSIISIRDIVTDELIYEE